METVEQTPIMTLEELQDMQSRYCETVNEEDYQTYLNIVKIHNEAKAKADHMMTGDVMIAKSLDGKTVYDRGHIENSQWEDEKFTVCVRPYIPFTSEHAPFSANGTSGGYWFTPKDNEEIELVGYRSKEFCTFGRCGAKADGAFHFNLIVSVWEVKSEKVY